MNFKERGITVGDLLILIIVVSSSYLLFNKIKSNDNQSKSNIFKIELIKPIKS